MSVDLQLLDFMLKLCKTSPVKPVRETVGGQKKYVWRLVSFFIVRVRLEEQYTYRWRWSLYPDDFSVSSHVLSWKMCQKKQAFNTPKTGAIQNCGNPKRPYRIPAKNDKPLLFTETWPLWSCGVPLFWRTPIQPLPGYLFAPTLKQKRSRGRKLPWAQQKARGLQWNCLVESWYRHFIWKVLGNYWWRAYRSMNYDSIES